MIVGKVIGNLWSTIQEATFNGKKLLLVQPYNFVSKKTEGAAILAVDLVASGIGDNVLLVYEGASSRQELAEEKTPCEAVIVGVVDEIQLYL